MPLETALVRLAEAGCRTTEVAAMRPYLHRARAIRGSLDHHGLSVATVSLGPPFFFSSSKLDLSSPSEEVRRSSLAYVRRAIEFASTLEAGLVYVCSLSRSPTQQSRHAAEFLKTAFVECSGFASSAGVRFAVEPFPTGELPSVRAANDLLDEIGIPDVGIVFDTGHAAIAGEGLSDSARSLRGRLCHVHMNNNDGVRDLHWRLGKGKLSAEEFRGLMRELDRQRYEGVLSVELTKPGPIRKAVEDSRRFVANLV